MLAALLVIQQGGFAGIDVWLLVLCIFCINPVFANAMLVVLKRRSESSEESFLVAA